MAERFIKSYSQGVMNGNEIWVDRETGVNYLFHFAGYGGGLTVLLNADGTPIVTPVNNNYDVDPKYSPKY